MSINFPPCGTRCRAGPHAHHANPGSRRQQHRAISSQPKIIVVATGCDRSRTQDDLRSEVPAELRPSVPCDLGMLPNHSYEGEK